MQLFKSNIKYIYFICIQQKLAKQYRTLSETISYIDILEKLITINFQGCHQVLAMHLIFRACVHNNKIFSLIANFKYTYCNIEQCKSINMLRFQKVPRRKRKRTYFLQILYIYYMCMLLYIVSIIQGWQIVRKIKGQQESSGLWWLIKQNYWENSNLHHFRVQHFFCNLKKI